jgi:sphingolipid 4-desaturase/C4-monooxygenase
MSIANVPWQRLRKLHQIAREFYDPLYSTRSWTALMVSYLFDPRYRLNQYVGMGGEWIEELAPLRRSSGTPRKRSRHP